MGLFSRREGMAPTVEPELPFPAPPPPPEPDPAPAADTTPAARAPRTRKLIRLDWRLRFIAYATFAASVGALCWLAVMLVYYTIVFPDPQSVRAKERAPLVRVLARDGSVLSERGAAPPSNRRSSA